MTKAEAIDISSFFAGGKGAVGENTQQFAWGNPAVYREIWYKFLLPSYYESYNCSVWNLGGPYATPYPPLDDEYYPPPPAQPGHQYPCKVTLYDASDNVITSGEHIQLTSQGRFGTWLYFKVEQPAPHFYDQNMLVSQSSKFRIQRMNRGIVQPGHIMIQGNDKIAVLQPNNYLGGTSQLYNYVFPELTGHSVGGGAGDILLTGVNCIEDGIAGGVTVRSKYYLAPTTFAIGGPVYNITCNADRVSNFWVSHTEGGVHKCRPIHIHSQGQFPYSPVNCSLGAPLGITAVVDRLRARADQILYYVEQGSYEVKMWDIKANKLLKVIPGDNALGVITDILIIPGGDVLIGYNSGTYPTTYTIRRIDGLANTFVRDYVFTSNGIYNRINYTQDNGHIMIWTHEQTGLSTFRYIRLSDGAVVWTVHSKEYENDTLILDSDLYRTEPYYPQYGIPQNTSQPNGPTSRWNFWVAPVYVNNNTNATNGEGIMYVDLTGPPPDDEFYPPIYLPPLPGEPPTQPPPYPGYPWIPPPPALPNDPPLNPPQVVPLPVKIGGGLILLDPTNVNRTDQYQSTTGTILNVPIKMNIRTAFLGD